MVRLEHVTDLETAKQMAALLEAENARLHQRLTLLVQENARLKGEDAQERLQLELVQLKEQLALMRQRLFGASSEKRKPGAEAPVPASARKQRGHGPRAQPELPVQEVVLPLDEADKVCGLCGGALKEWKGQTEDSQEVSVVERHFVLKRYRRQKYRCPCGCAPVTAPAPPRLIEGGRYSVDFAVHVALQKYCFHLPLARQERMFQREGLMIDSQTLWDPLSALASHLRPSYEALPAVIFSFPLIHADETHWYMLDKGPGKKWYAWTVACADAVYHRILPSRSGATAKQVLGDYKGLAMVDGYAAYQTATKSGADGPASCSLVFCWAHVRRKFVEAEKGLYCTIRGLKNRSAGQRSVNAHGERSDVEGSATVAAIGGERIQVMGSGCPRPGGSAMDRISGSPSGSGSSTSAFYRAVRLRDARQRRVEHQPPAA